VTASPALGVGDATIVESSDVATSSSVARMTRPPTLALISVGGRPRHPSPRHQDDAIGEGIGLLQVWVAKMTVLPWATCA